MRCRCACRICTCACRAVLRSAISRHWPEQLFDVLPDDVCFEIDGIAPPSRAEIRVRERVRNRRDGKARRVDRRHRETDAVDRDGTLFDDVAQDFRSCENREPDGIGVPSDEANASDPVDVAGHDVAAETACRRHGAFEIHCAADAEAGEGRAVQGFMHDVRRELVGAQRGDRKADAVDRDAVAEFRALEHGRGTDCEDRRVAATRDLLDYSDFFDDSGEHGYSTSLSIRMSSLGGAMSVAMADGRYIRRYVSGFSLPANMDTAPHFRLGCRRRTR